MLNKTLIVNNRHILRAVVAMVNHPSCFLRTYDRLIERLQQQRFTYASEPTSTHTINPVRGEHIGYKSAVEKPLQVADISHITPPTTDSAQELNIHITPRPGEYLTPEVCELS